MYKILTIGGKDYKLEYTMEASLYADCLEELTLYIEEFARASVDADSDAEKGLMGAIRTIADTPQKVVTLFYAGLLEYHGPEGDNSVPDKTTAKNLLKQYFDENKGGEYADFFSMMSLIVDQMGEDGFFELTGLNKLIQTSQTDETGTEVTTTTQTSRKKKKDTEDN